MLPQMEHADPFIQQHNCLMEQVDNMPPVDCSMMSQPSAMQIDQAAKPQLNIEIN